MKIAIISDTHDSHRNIVKAVDILNERKVDYVLHAGDIIAPFAARAFANVKGAKFIAVFGNNEGEKIFLKQSVEEFGGEIHEYAYRGRLGGRSIFMTHVPTTIDEVAASGRYDVVIYGHTHKRDIRRQGNTLVINPGEATDWLSGESGFVILDLDDLSYEVVAIE